MNLNVQPQLATSLTNTARSVLRQSLACVAAAISYFLGRSRVSARYWVHAAALFAGVLAMPLTHALVRHDAQPPARAAAAAPVASVAADSVPRRQPAAPPISVPPSQSLTLRMAASGSQPEVVRTANAASTAGVWRVAAPWLAGAYLLGVALMLARLTWAAVKLESKGSRATPVVDGPIADAFRTLCQRWSVRAAPTLAYAERIAVPLVVGLLKPTILLPTTALTGLSIGELEMILAHELAHVRRHDVWVNLVQRLAEAICFFNPAAWWLSRRISTLREYCCDEAACSAVAGGGDETHLRYATALLRVAELSRGEASRQQLTAVAASGRTPSELRRRVARLFGEPLREPLRLSRGGVLMLVVGTALVLCLPPLVESETRSPSSKEKVAPPSSVTTAPTEADQAVAAARRRTFGLQDVPKIAFQQVYRQVEVPDMQAHPDDNLASFWKARDAEVAEAEYERNRHETALAWDDGKLALESFTQRRPRESWRQTHYWDGREGWLGETSVNKEGETKNIYRYAAIDKLCDRIMPFYFPQWAAAGDRLPWPGPTVLLDDPGAEPDLTRYRLVGERTIDGALCDEYDGPQRHEKIWIDRQSGLVKAFSRHYVWDSPNDDFLQTVSDFAGRKIDNQKDYVSWYKSLSPDELSAFNAHWSAITWELTKPGNLTVFSDYREVAPGVHWPCQAIRIHAHGSDGGGGAEKKTFSYSLAKITAEPTPDFDIKDLAAHALPTKGVKVTDRRGKEVVDYVWPLAGDEAAIEQLRDEKLAAKQAKSEADRAIEEQPIDSVDDAIRVLTEGPAVDPTKAWARAIKHLADHPEPALLALIAALDKEDRDHPISKLAFALRAIGDRRAVPALIRALPRTHQPSRSDYALRIDDETLGPFMQEHDNGKGTGWSESMGWLFTYSRAFREVVGALHKLTGEEFNEMELNWIHRPDSEPQRSLAQQQFDRVARRWAEWWEANWRTQIDDPAYAQVGLTESAPPKAKPPVVKSLPSGPTVKLVAISQGGTIQSANDTGKACFVDLDTKRQADWPDELPPPREIALDSPELLAFARREGFDVVGVTRTPEGESEELYCLMPLDLPSWKITEDEHRGLADMVSGKRPYPTTRPVSLLAPPRTIPQPLDPKHSGDSYLFITREGTAGVLRLTAQVTEARDITGYARSEDELFQQYGYFRGVRYVLQTMNAP